MIARSMTAKLTVPSSCLSFPNCWSRAVTRSLLFLTSLQAVCKCIPPAQATDFLTAVLDSLLHVTPTRATAVRKWVFIFLVECRKEILQEVRETFFPSDFVFSPVGCCTTPCAVGTGSRNAACVPSRGATGGLSRALAPAAGVCSSW